LCARYARVYGSRIPRGFSNRQGCDSSLRAATTCGETLERPASLPPCASRGTGKGWTKLEGLWSCNAFIPASENPIVGNRQTAKDCAFRSKRRWSDIISDVQETSLTSDSLPSSSPTCTRNSILQHFRKVRNDCIKLFVLTQQVKSDNANRGAATRELRAYSDSPLEYQRGRQRKPPLSCGAYRRVSAMSPT
jgi:hypothetical protein